MDSPTTAASRAALSQKKAVSCALGGLFVPVGAVIVGKILEAMLGSPDHHRDPSSLFFDYTTLL